jgi:alkylhydroperoxidase family enzyme
MSWLTLPEDEATPELARLTAAWRERGQQVPPVIGVLKARPATLSAVLSLNYALTFGASSLGRRAEELIAVWVSALNDCFFCLATHARYLEQQWKGPPVELQSLLEHMKNLAERARTGGEPERQRVSRALATLPALDSSERELLDFVLGLTLAPAGVEHDDFSCLRAAGFDETECLDAVLVAGCFALMNRLANGTGVVLDPSKHMEAERLFGRAALERHLARGR